MKALARTMSEQRDAHHPVELARPVVAAGEQHARGVQQQHHDEQVGAPVVDAAHERPEQHAVLDREHRIVGDAGHRLVGEHQQDARDRQDGDEHQRGAAEAEGVGEANRACRHLHGPEVQQQRVDGDEGAIAIGFGNDRSAQDDRLPDAPEQRGARRARRGWRRRLGGWREAGHRAGIVADLIGRMPALLPRLQEGHRPIRVPSGECGMRDA